MRNIKLTQADIKYLLKRREETFLELSVRQSEYYEGCLNGMLEVTNELLCIDGKYANQRFTYGKYIEYKLLKDKGVITEEQEKKESNDQPRDTYKMAQRLTRNARIELAKEIEASIEVHGEQCGLSNAEIIGILETTKLRYFAQERDIKIAGKKVIYESTQPDNPYKNMMPIQCEKCGGAMYAIGNYKDGNDTMLVYKCATCGALTNQEKIEDGDDTFMNDILKEANKDE